MPARPTRAEADPVLASLAQLAPPGLVARRLLALGWPQAEDCARLKAAFAPDSLTWLGVAPPRPPKGVTCLDGVEALSEDMPPFDLILAGPALGQGSRGAARAAAIDIERLLAPGGIALMALSTYATPAEAGPPCDVLLFPALAAAGDLGEAARARPCLGPANWLLLLRSVGLEAQAVDGYGAAPPSAETLARHGPRLALFDAREIATSRLIVRAMRRGDAG